MIDRHSVLRHAVDAGARAIDRAPRRATRPLGDRAVDPPRDRPRGRSSGHGTTAARSPLLALAMLAAQTAAHAQAGPPQADGSRWNPAAGGDTLDAGCADVAQWGARQRERMAAAGGWCSVEVQFGYAGAAGDIKVAIEKERRAARSSHASVDLPGNGGETTPFQFIFPCPAATARRLCLLYAATTDATEVRFDLVELGADATPKGSAFEPLDSAHPAHPVQVAHPAQPAPAAHPALAARPAQSAHSTPRHRAGTGAASSEPALSEPGHDAGWTRILRAPRAPQIGALPVSLGRAPIVVPSDFTVAFDRAVASPAPAPAPLEDFDRRRAF